MFRVGKLILLGLLALVASCGSEENDQAKPRVTTVFAYFYSDQDTQWVFIDSVYNIDEPVEDTFGVSGANVRLVAPKNIPFTEDISRPGHYYAPFHILPGTDYTIKVNSPIGDSCTMSSRSPLAFDLLAPGDSDTLDVDAMWIIWTDPGNPGYGLFISCQDTARTDSATGEPYRYDFYFPWIYPNGDTSAAMIPPMVLDTINYWYRFRAVAADTVVSGLDNFHFMVAFWSHGVDVFIRDTTAD